MARLICDTAPLLAAVDRRDPAHVFSASLVTEIGRELLIPEPVITEVDYLVRERVGAEPARLFLMALDTGEHTPVFMTPGLLRRAVEIDEQYADLDLGFVDASVMAYAERHDLEILTFDFRDFRATRPRIGTWRLFVDEDQYRRAIMS